MPKKAVTSAATMLPLAIGLLSTAIMPPAKGGGGARCERFRDDG